jgi:hypothetical protein
LIEEAAALAATEVSHSTTCARIGNTGGHRVIPRARRAHETALRRKSIWIIVSSFALITSRLADRFR